MKNFGKNDLIPGDRRKATSDASYNSSIFSLLHIFEAKGLYLACAVFALVILILFNKYIFFNRLLLFTDVGTDSINFDWPQRCYYSKYLRSEGIPTWSFAQGLGANVFPASMGDVGNWLLYLAPPAYVAYVFAYVEMLKLFLSGVLFFIFLKKINITT